MKICGLKLTHDGSVAGIEDGKLIFCVEAEKIANGARYSRIDDMGMVRMILDHFDFVPDRWVVDGWKGQHISIHDMWVAPYHEFDGSADRLTDEHTAGRPISERTGWLDFYSSYPHMTGHIFSAYCTAPWSKNKEDAYVITWDGGQNPRVHFVSPRTGTVEFVKSLHDMYGILYGTMGRYFGPFKIEGIEHQAVTSLPLNVRFGGYDVPGKLMSYIALGKACDEFVVQMMGIYHNLAAHEGRDLRFYQDGMLEHRFMRRVLEMASERFPTLTDADVLATIHKWLEVMLVDNAIAAIPAGSNLAFVGGSALNIKWNSALRRTGHFKSIWVPPFPNDSGSAIGQACAMMALKEGIWSLDWSVYCGMPVLPSARLPGWSAAPCTIEQLAGFFAAHDDEPVVFLNGRAEVGPRALGNRSIFMSAVRSDGKDRINAIKGREHFRPVAPICKEENAKVIFEPGTPDPYMLFDHMVSKSWKDRIPAIVHLDGSARLQTVNEEQNPEVYDLLDFYEAHTGIPLLCNTSANLNGSGFFPDVESAMRWGKIRHIWSNGVMYVRESR